MNVIVRTAGFFALTAVVAAPAFAAEPEDPYGPPESVVSCQSSSDWKGMHFFKKADLPADCAAELERRVQACLKDPARQKIFNDKQYSASKDPPGYCGEIVVGRAKDQLERYADEQKKAKEEAEKKQQLEAMRMPKADMHDAKIEKSIADTFRKAFPESKIIKVIITDRSWDYEKDAFGRITGRDITASVVNKHPDGKCEIFSEMWVQQGNGKSYKGPFEERGAGSLNKVEILCENTK